MKVKINSNACIGCGACQAICPKVFELGDDGYATVIKEEIKEEEKNDCIEASEGCPTSAIVIEEK